MQPLKADDPTEIGGYRLRGRLGGGGMGRVYLASTPGGAGLSP
jgi:eukaryotic-like serine/threonine-protein kinase